MKRLLVTDLDNTLYDWVTFYAHSFNKMSLALAGLLQLSHDAVLSEFKAIHQWYGNSEQPFAALELPAVQRAFPGASREQLAANLSGPLDAFNQERARRLRLYEGVAKTLNELRALGIVIVGHTEALSVNAWYRLRNLEIAHLFSRVYALEGPLKPHPARASSEAVQMSTFLHTVPRSERKPNPALLRNICAREGVELSEACYIGDSLTRDVAMANAAGVTSVWAKYGTYYDQSLWAILVRVTHWTAEDVEREAQLKRAAHEIVPDHVIESFAELLGILTEQRDPL